MTFSPSARPSLNAHRADWMKLIGVWDKVVHYIDDPKTQDDAIKIMAARVRPDAGRLQATARGHPSDRRRGGGRRPSRRPTVSPRSTARPGTPISSTSPTMCTSKLKTSTPTSIHR